MMKKICPKNDKIITTVSLEKGFLNSNLSWEIVIVKDNNIKKIIYKIILTGILI